MKLSYSAISTYQKCPKAYKFQYIDKLPSKKTSALSFGSSIHAALEFMYKVATPNPPTLDEVFEALVGNWETEGYRDEIDERNYLEHGKRILEQFYASNVESFDVPVVLEHKFLIDVDGLNLTGVIDRVDKLPSGRYEIIDYKTNKRLPPKSKVERDLQLSIYHLAAEEIWGFAPEKLSLYFVVPNEKMSSSRVPDQIRKTREEILKVADDITAEKFPAIENHLCPWCDYRRWCPYFSDQFSFKNESKTLLESDVRVLVDEYIEIERRLAEEEARREEVRSKILSFCEANNLARVYGSSGSLARRETRRFTFDIQALKNALEPAGLWTNVLGVDNKLVKELLDSPETSSDVKAGIEEAKRQTGTVQSLRVDKAAKSRA